MEVTSLRNFTAETPTAEQTAALEAAARAARRDVLEMIAHAGSGHVGGSLSSLDIDLMLLAVLDRERGDRFVVSCGHTAAGLYAALGRTGAFPPEEAVAGFRRGGPFEGHPSLRVPGVEWTSGALGQGLSVGCGMALAAKLRGSDARVYVLLGDGEQSKGQLQEAREFAVKYRLSNLTAVIDCNGLQASGALDDVMPQRLREKYLASGWNVIETDGHDFNALYRALRGAALRGEPTAILARTVMGRGVPAIENCYEYHGKVPSPELWRAAFPEKRDDAVLPLAAPAARAEIPELRVRCGTPRDYGAAADCRTAAGNALLDLAAANPDLPFAAFDCDLLESVKLAPLRKAFPGKVIECGIQEQNAATAAAAMSKSGVLTFWADFAVFGIDEVFGQLRMADCNETSLKLICTHAGLDVGEDGKTHQCTDYLSLTANLHRFKVIVPADANQTDRAIRYAARTPGNIAVCMGRSKLPVLTRRDGSACFGGDYEFVPGRAEVLRSGSDATLAGYGTVMDLLCRTADLMAERGVSVEVLNFPAPAEFCEDAVCAACRTGILIAVEDHNVRTGFGTMLGAAVLESGRRCQFRRIGVTGYGASASPAELYRREGLETGRLCRLIETVKLKQGDL